MVAYEFGVGNGMVAQQHCFTATGCIGVPGAGRSCWQHLAMYRFMLHWCWLAVCACLCAPHPCLPACCLCLRMCVRALVLVPVCVCAQDDLRRAEAARRDAERARHKEDREKEKELELIRKQYLVR